MKENWFLQAKRADFNQIGKDFGVDPVIARLMRNRDLESYEQIDRYLHGTVDDMYDPLLLTDMDLGTQLIQQKIQSGCRIRIISDYDVDGVSSNYILYQGLKRCGALVDYQIPDRLEDGYGINQNLIQKACDEGIDTIITCDNGIAASKEIAFGKKLGMTFVVTDHHEVPYQEKNQERTYILPPADAVIDPKRPGDKYPFKNICGAVVAYKFIQALYRKCGIMEEEVRHFLEIAALATNCDVMPLQDENRIIMKEGLRQMNHTDNVGLQALIQENNLSGQEIKGYTLGFVLGPCINASGRLSTAKTALELLLSRDPIEASRMASELTELNRERKELTRIGEKNAVEYLELSGHRKDAVLVVYLPDLHESIAGIVAGRVREMYNKPVFVITKSKDGLKGSGRSIETYSMYEEMTKVKECFTKFGGHPMAAGLSLPEDLLEEFRRKINDCASLTEEDFVPKVSIDLQLPVWYLKESLIEQLHILEPCGVGNEKPLFADRNLRVMDMRVLGESGRVIRFYLEDERRTGITAVYFGSSEQFFSEAEEFYGQKIKNFTGSKSTGQNQMIMDVCYYPEINEWRGNRSIQMIIRNYRFQK